ncbi:MAG: coenzyme F420-0:L-glutamate ligase [Chloroflexi bacterium]|nr:coenzyme F420-0:L-glutamate ligase [Chloroflexota bacterium]
MPPPKKRAETSSNPNHPYPEVQVTGIAVIPEVGKGDDLALLISEAARRQGTPIKKGDVVVVTQKVVSKAEGRVILLKRVKPSPLAVSIARQHGKDPRHVEAVLRESRRIVRMDHGVIIAETRHGFICANAGVDASNLPDEESVCLLPKDPDGSARGIREGIERRLGVEIAVIITDTFGRPWREGFTNVAVGVSGLDALLDYRGTSDAYGHPLKVTVMAQADEIASAASLVCQKTTGVPVAIVRGFGYKRARGKARDLVREPSLDLFR